MFACAEPILTLNRSALRPMTLRVQRMEMAQPASAQQPTLMVLRRGQVLLQPRPGASARRFEAGWATLDPCTADYAQERWSAPDETHYHAVELPVPACEELLHGNVPWSAAGRRPLRFSDPKVSWWVEEMVGHCLAGEPHGSLYTDAVGLSLLTYLTSHCARLPAPDGGASVLPRSVVLKVQDHIDAHLADPLNLRDLAALCGYSPGHLNRMFKAAVGLPLHRFVIERRLRAAQAMLAADHAALADIALACGFANQAHFSTAFRRYVGCTPRAFRVSGAR